MESCTAQGHVVGMLDRDQRTAKMCIFDRHVVRDRERSPVPLTGRNETISHRSVPGRTSPCRCRTRKNAHFWKSLHRLKHALIVGAYLSLVTFPSILSAPTLRKPMSSWPSDEPWWLNPCGTGNENGGGGASAGDQVSDKTLLDQILFQTHQVQIWADHFKESYVQKTFNNGFHDHHNFYKDKDFDWLPTKYKIPKKLNEPLPEGHLESLELEETLVNVHTYLQQIAVGMEQMVHDEKEGKGPFVSELETTEKHLRAILCEIRTAIIEKDLPMPENVTRDIMEDEYREMDNTSMKLRNWVIYRDYLMMLEYIMEVFQYLKNKIPPIG